MHSSLHKLRPFDVPWQQFYEQMQPLGELRTIHTAGSNKCAYIPTLYPLLIVNSEFTTLEQ